MILISIAVFAGSAALIGGAEVLAQGKPSLAQMLTPPKPNAVEVANTEAADLQHRLNCSVLGLGAVLVGYYLAPLPLGLASTPLAVYLQWPGVKATWADITDRHTIDSTGLMSVAFAGAWIYGAYMGTAFAIFAYLLTRKTALRACEHSQRKLIRRFEQQQQTVWRLVDGVEIETPLHQVWPGDTVVAYAGESIPVDGTVIAGTAAVDQCHLGGDAGPVQQSEGDGVFATARVLRGWLHVRVDRAGKETVAMQIANSLRHTVSHRLAIERRGLKLAEDCVAPSLALSIAALPLLGFYSAIAVLLARPGIDMNFAAPLALLNALQLSTNHGILVRDGRGLELMQAIDTVVFDQTAVLEPEGLDVATVHACGNYDKWQVLAYAAMAENQQSQTIAQAILDEARQCGLKLPGTGSFRYKNGFGIQVIISGQRVRVGNQSFIGNAGLALPPTLQEVCAQCMESGHSLTFVATEDALVGALELRPALRPEVADVVSELKRRNFRLAILSGDRTGPTRHLAERVGIAEYFAEMPPEDKARHIERLQQKGRAVCFLSSGTDTAAAMTATHVSVSLHGDATRIATETAQIVLMGHSPRQLPLLFDLSRCLDFNLKTSFRISIATGAGIIGSIFLFHSGIGIVAALNASAAITIIGNAMLPLQGSREKTAHPQLDIRPMWHVPTRPPST